jgi:2-methylisocitrate lyase-like PEP mutase family enzyme
VSAFVIPQDRLMDNDRAKANFRALHTSGSFVMPNAHDIGSCRLLTALGFQALATTSGGFAASMGRQDMTTSRAELVEHARTICGATDLPVNVDSEQCFPDEEGGVEETVDMLADAGAAGCSIEDWDSRGQQIEDFDLAVSRVATAARAADRSGLVLTARAENHLHGRDDLSDTINRLAAYRDAGAGVVYAPGLKDLNAIARVVNEVGGPVNVLLMPGEPSCAQLADAGVRRISVGSSLARIAYGALVRAAEQLISDGTLPADVRYLDRELANRAFSAGSAEGR